MSLRIMSVALRDEQDVVAARQRARQISGSLGFESQDQVRIATAVSEIARNAFRYAGGGEVEFSIEGESSPQSLSIQVNDTGPGIANLDLILSGKYRSATGMGLGIIGAQRLMDHFNIHSGPGKTSVTMQKVLPGNAPPITAGDLGWLTKKLAAGRPAGPMDEIAQQNTELIRTLGELRERQDDLLALNRELEDTNRGVVALYAELEERAEFLRQADQTKTRFLSNMSHEFRTPLNSMRALTSLLLDRSDGTLTAEQTLQVGFIGKATADLTQLVDDLLDLAKIEAGKVEVRCAEFVIEEMLSALRGMLKPLLVSDTVALRFEDTAGLPSMYGDEGKVSQILRNFISNALKFTERGEIRVAATLAEDGAAITFSVADTGIGIAEEDRSRVFEEFAQVPNPLQAGVKGTGLGLPLCRRLAELLGGEIAVQSNLGQGSTFSVTLPVRHDAAAHEDPRADAPRTVDFAAVPLSKQDERPTLLVIDDDPAARYAICKLCVRGPYRVLEAANARDGLIAASAARPRIILLDLNLPDRSGEEVLRDLADDPATREIPVVVVTSEQLSPRQHDRLRRLAAAVLPKSDLSRESFDRILETLNRPHAALHTDATS